MSRTATIVDWVLLAQKRNMPIKDIRQLGILYARVHASLGMINASHAPEWAMEGVEELNTICKMLSVDWITDTRLVRVNATDCINEIRQRLTGYSYEYAIQDEEEDKL